MSKQTQVDAALLIEELKGQRNSIADQLAIAGAMITALRKELEKLTPHKDEPVT